MVDAPGSNSGWHQDWAWYEGGELERHRPWQKISSPRVKFLNRPGSVSVEKLNDFHNSSIRFSSGDFSDVDFLSSHLS